MEKLKAPWEADEEDLGCAYILDECGDRRICGAPCYGAPGRPVSAYCPHHHALCHIASGSKAEVHRLREVEALASAVGGRRGRDDNGPSRQFLKRLEHAARVSS
ncbi:MAG TPA: hypothetical protein VJX94_32315 [Stellaceae bacterium]|nr:hypothetical protein [Stellaceae bacterium]